MKNIKNIVRSGILAAGIISSTYSSHAQESLGSVSMMKDHITGIEIELLALIFLDKHQRKINLNFIIQLMTLQTLVI